MTSLNKKNKCKRTLYDRGGEKGNNIKGKRVMIYHKKDRVRLSKEVLEYKE